MTGFAKLPMKALRALAEEYEIQLPAGRIAKNGLIKILQSENIQPPWDGPEWECPTPASLMKAGLLLGIAPRSIWRTVQAHWPDCRGSRRTPSPDPSPWRREAPWLRLGSPSLARHASPVPRGYR